MFDTTLHTKTLARQLRKKDFHSDLWDVDRDQRDAIVAEAVSLAATGFQTVALREVPFGTKTVYRQTSLPETLLIRQISEGVRRITGVRQSDRQAIVRSLIELVREGIPFGALKLDIRSFYESVDTSDLVSKLRSDPAFSRQSIFVLNSFFSALEANDIVGLPRGIGLSATLAEYVLRSFDDALASYPGVRFYSRYVDDAIIITSPGVDLSALRQFAASNLPTGLTLHRAKTKPFEFTPFNRSNGDSIEHCLSFLGYSLSISHIQRLSGSLGRVVKVDMSANKVSRIKKRLARSLWQFAQDSRFDDLLNRVKLLTSNYGYADVATGQTRYSGIRYNYPLLDLRTSVAIPSLDRFLTNVMTSKHQNNRLRPQVSKQQLRKILGFSFESGFANNRFFQFRDDELKRIVRCWAHA